MSPEDSIPLEALWGLAIACWTILLMQLIGLDRFVRFAEWAVSKYPEWLRRFCFWIFDGLADFFNRINDRIENRR